MHIRYCRYVFINLPEGLNLVMEVKVDIPFEELVSIVKQLSPTEKARLQKEMELPAKGGPKNTLPVPAKTRRKSGQRIEPTTNHSRLTALLLNGPVFTDAQIKAIKETRKSINGGQNPYD